MDNETYKICPKCGTACEPDHAFCSKCGSSFGAGEYNKGYGRPTYYKDTLDGVPTAEVVDYIDQNSYSYLPKFFKYSGGAKAGWNWPVFVFGLLGIPFVWFFYRKLYKAGWIVMAISVAIVLLMAGALGVAFSAMEEPMTDYIEEVYEIEEKYGMSADLDGFEFYDDGYSGYYGTQDEFSEEINQVTQRFVSTLMNDGTFKAMTVLLQLLSYLQTAFAVILPIFSNYIYYKKAMSDLKTLNEGGYPNGHTVQSKGGVKVSAAIWSAVGGYAAMIIGCIAVMMPFIISIMNSVIERFTLV